MKIGSLFFDSIQDRMDVRFGPSEYLGGLLPDEEFDVLENGVWQPTKLKKGHRWYLLSIHCKCYSKKGPKRGTIVIEKSPTCSPMSASVVG